MEVVFSVGRLALDDPTAQSRQQAVLHLTERIGHGSSLPVSWPLWNQQSPLLHITSGRRLPIPVLSRLWDCYGTAMGLLWDSDFTAGEGTSSQCDSLYQVWKKGGKEGGREAPTSQIDMYLLSNSQSFPEPPQDKLLSQNCPGIAKMIIIMGGMTTLFLLIVRTIQLNDKRFDFLSWDWLIQKIVM